jgi:hypothetical protein
MWPRVSIRTPATATLTCSSERARARARARARKSARRCGCCALLSVCLVCLAAVVVAHRVPPPVSARSGRSFFSLARGPGAGCRCRAHRWDAAGRQCPFVPPVAEPRLGQPVRRIKGTVSCLLVSFCWEACLGHCCYCYCYRCGCWGAIWGLTMDRYKVPSIEPWSQNARGTRRANEPPQRRDKGGQPQTAAQDQLAGSNVREEARTQSPEKALPHGSGPLSRPESWFKEMKGQRKRQTFVAATQKGHYRNESAFIAYQHETSRTLSHGQRT